LLLHITIANAPQAKCVNNYEIIKQKKCSGIKAPADGVNKHQNM